jgi:PncC family amidohydrolase
VLRDEDPVAARVAAALRSRGWRLAVAETTAGGLISARLLSVPGASAWFDRGVVCYSAAAKMAATGVPAAVLEEHGAVSEAAVTAMAQGLRALSGADVALAESGIAGPLNGRRSTKPVGAVVIAIAGPGGMVVRDAVFPGSRIEVMAQIAGRALELLAETLDAYTFPAVGRTLEGEHGR